MLNSDNQEKLIEIARFSIEEYINNGKIYKPVIDDKELNVCCGAFVSIYEEESLRGCIGRIMSDDEPLWEIVRNMAIEASNKDHRFDPVNKEELNLINIEISVLSVPRKIDDWHDIELGRHGVIIKKDYSSGVFLPQVASETGWSKEEFLSQLCVSKAGLAHDCYKNDSDVELYTFEAQVFKEN